MGEARELLDRSTAAWLARDFKALGDCYSEDAVLVTPYRDGVIRGRERIVKFLRANDAFSNEEYESVQKYESGNAAIDEGYATGTHTGPWTLPSGDTIPATGKTIRHWACDVVTVNGGFITEHHLHVDRGEIYGQLGLLPLQEFTPSAR